MSAIDSILTTEQYRTQQANAIYKDGEDGDMLGRDAFLQLFTAQLKNQNPLDPMENEAFVAQLAQFSSVEGCLLYTSPSPRDREKSRMPSSA